VGLSVVGLSVVGLSVVGLAVGRGLSVGADEGCPVGIEVVGSLLGWFDGAFVGGKDGGLVLG